MHRPVSRQSVSRHGLAIGLLALCILPAPGLAQQAPAQPLTSEQIVDFFTRGDGAAPTALAPSDGTRMRGLTLGQPAPGAVTDRSVFIGPAGFGDGSDSGGAGDATAIARETAAPDAAPAGLDLLITFELDSDRLTGEARRNLDAFIQALRHPALTGLRFAVEGHTDATGPAGYNLALSRRRADAVAGYLSAQGVDPARLSPKGYGETLPRTAPPEDPRNRRVETRRLD